jgi:hypothetical protein
MGGFVLEDNTTNPPLFQQNQQAPTPPVRSVEEKTDAAPHAHLGLEGPYHT